MREQRDRDSYRDVGEALRRALVRANAAELSEGGWRVLSVVLQLTASWSRLEERVDAPQIAGAAGLSIRRTRGWLKKLDELGIITWKPARGTRPDGKPRSIIALPSKETPVASTLKQDASSVPFDPSKQDAEAVSNRTPSRPVLREVRGKKPEDLPSRKSAAAARVGDSVEKRAEAGEPQCPICPAKFPGASRRRIRDHLFNAHEYDTHEADAWFADGVLKDRSPVPADPEAVVPSVADDGSAGTPRATGAATDGRSASTPPAGALDLEWPGLP